MDAGQRRSRTWSWVAPYQPRQAPYAGSTAPLTGAAASLTRNAITSAIAWGATACAIMSAGCLAVTGRKCTPVAIGIRDLVRVQQRSRIGVMTRFRGKPFGPWVMAQPGYKYSAG